MPVRRIALAEDWRLGGPANFEAGFVYRLTPRQRRQVAGLMEFAGPTTEVHADGVPRTVQPLSEEDAFVPRFLAEVVASGSVVSIRFRDTVPRRSCALDAHTGTGW